MVHYQSLSDEIKIGDYFLRVLLEEDQADNEDSPIKKSGVFFNDLYHRYEVLHVMAYLKANCVI